MLFLTSSFMLFSWELAQWVQMLQTRWWWWWVKKIGIGIFAYKQRLSSIQKFVKHVPRINERERERTRFPALVCRSDIFSWELWHLNSQERVMLRSQKSITIFDNKQWLLSIDMKTKVVKHVPRINLSHLNQKFQIFKNFKFLKFFLVPSFCLTFRHFLVPWGTKVPGQKGLGKVNFG